MDTKFISIMASQVQAIMADTGITPYTITIREQGVEIQAFFNSAAGAKLLTNGYRGEISRNGFVEYIKDDVRIVLT